MGLHLSINPYIVSQELAQFCPKEFFILNTYINQNRLDCAVTKTINSNKMKYSTSKFSVGSYQLSIMSSQDTVFLQCHHSEIWATKISIFLFSYFLWWENE